jgi:hypothetical protein
MALKNRRIKDPLLALVLTLCAMAAPAQQLYTGSAGVVAADVDKMYVRGLQYLVRTQTPAGNWPDEPPQGEPAVTSLALISLLAHGDDPNFGPYSATIRRALDYVLKQASKDGTGYIGMSMYNHGFSTLALAECYGAVDDPRLGPALQKAVKVIVSAQAESRLHAWRYTPNSTRTQQSAAHKWWPCVRPATPAFRCLNKSSKTASRFFVPVKRPTAASATNPPTRLIRRARPSDVSCWRWPRKRIRPPSRRPSTS